MKKYLFIIDDEKDFTFFIKKNLEATGQFDVTICNDATIAVERARQLRPTAILLDIMMPGIGGEDLATQLAAHAETKKIPVIFLTALVKAEETAGHANVIGGHRFVAKPVKIQELIGVINQVAGGP